MLVTMMKSKIHRAVVTQAELHYEGSITIDEDLLDAAGILVGEKVQVVNINNGVRFETYTIAGKRGAKGICLNGPAARIGYKGDRIVIITYAMMEESVAVDYNPKVVLVDETNTIVNN